jgi:type II secretion system protein G
MKLSLSKLKNNNGFTLIELLVVISIISLLSSVVLATLKDARQKAQNAKTVSEIKQLQNALELYRADNGKYPNEDAYGMFFTWEGYPDPQEYLTSVLTPKYVPVIPDNRTVHPSFGEDMSVYVTGNDFALYYDYPGEDYKFHLTCGGKKLKSYIYYFYNDQPLALPQVGYYERYSSTEEYYYSNELFFTGEGSNWYCIGE